MKVNRLCVIIQSVTVLLMTLGLIVLFSGNSIAKQWYPVEVDVWDPPFNDDLKRDQKEYIPLAQAGNRWNLCVAIPHLKDAYWLAVNYGLVEEARRLGVNLAIYEAGGYDRFEVQEKQIRQCLEKGVNGHKTDGLILSSLSPTAHNHLLDSARDLGIPVLDFINGIDWPDLSARVLVDNYDNGYQIGDYLKKLNPPENGDINVAWFPGPKGPGWSARGDIGFREAVAGSNITIISSRWGDTGKTVQEGLITEIMDELGENVADKLDYIVGTSVSAEAAVSVLLKRGLKNQIKVMSYYYNPAVDKGIKRGTILASPTDQQAITARMAVDTMVRILDKKPYYKHSAPRVEVIDRTYQSSWDSTTTLAPRGFRPIFTVEE